MIERVAIESFKSIESLELGLGQVNVLIGANGSGKSNILEAIGVLSAAAEGKVTDPTLLQRGVRPGVPMLYKSSFRKRGDDGGGRLSPHIFFSAGNAYARYEVTLYNPLKDPLPAWRFKTERWESLGTKIVGRSPRSKEKYNPEQGLAALKAVEQEASSPALALLRDLQRYVIYTPTTAVLRGIAPETQPLKPVGLSGGQLAYAIREVLQKRSEDEHTRTICQDTLEMIDWAKSFHSSPAAAIPMSRSSPAGSRVVSFIDKYMHPKRNRLSGYDASEGALFVLFLAVLAAHKMAPAVCAVENADHGLNPRLARRVMSNVCRWFLASSPPRQVLLTTQNPLVLDGLPLQDDRVRLLCVSRTNTGRTVVSRIALDRRVQDFADRGWSLSRLWVTGQLGGLSDV